MHEAAIIQRENAVSQTSSVEAEGPEISRYILWAFYAFVFAIPFEALETEFTSTSFSLSKIFGYVFLFSILLQPRTVFRWVPLSFWLFLIYIVVFVANGALQGSGDPVVLMTQFLTLLQMVVLFLVSYNIFHHHRYRRNFLIVFAGSCLALSVLQAMGVGMTPTSYGRYERLASFGQGLNEQGAVLSLGIVSLFGLAYRVKGRGLISRLIPWSAMVLIAIPLTATGSRGAFAASLLGILMFLLAGRTFRERLGAIAVGTLTLGFLIFLVSQSDLARTRWESTLEHGNLAKREEIFPQALAMIAERPLQGWGPIKNTEELGRRLGVPRRDTHNAFLWFLTEVGLVGALPVFAGMFLCWRAGWRGRRGVDGLLPLALLVALITINMAGTYHTRKWFWLVLAFAMATDFRALSVRHG